MDIPKSFKLFGETIRVVENHSLLSQNEWAGKANYIESKIEMLPISESYPVTRVGFEQTFLHEVVHLILEAISEDELRTNEKFVDLFGRALHQVITTMEF